MKKMARQLKSDLLNLQQVFTKTHDRFRIVRASVDEMLCRFCMQNKSFYDIQANIPVSVHCARVYLFKIERRRNILF